MRVFCQLARQWSEEHSIIGLASAVSVIRFTIYIYRRWVVAALLAGIKAVQSIRSPRRCLGTLYLLSFNAQSRSLIQGLGSGMSLCHPRFLGRKPSQDDPQRLGQRSISNLNLHSLARKPSPKSIEAAIHLFPKPSSSPVNAFISLIHESDFLPTDPTASESDCRAFSDLLASLSVTSNLDI